MIYKLTRAELKTRMASEFKEGDIIHVGKYYINIRYGNYTIPSLKTTVETEEGKILDCTAGLRGSWPYYIDNFIRRRKNEK